MSNGTIWPYARVNVGPFGRFEDVCWAPHCEAPVADLTVGVRLCKRHLQKAWATMEYLAANDPDMWPNGEPLQQRSVRDVEAHGTVYFARVGELIKIGWSSDVDARLSHLHADAVFHTQPGTRHDERALHAKFNHLLVKGREWFRADPELLAYIKGLR